MGPRQGHGRNRGPDESEPCVSSEKITSVCLEHRRHCFNLAFVTAICVHSLCFSTVSTVAASHHSCDMLLIMPGVSTNAAYSAV